MASLSQEFCAFTVAIVLECRPHKSTDQKHSVESIIEDLVQFEYCHDQNFHVNMAALHQGLAIYRQRWSRTNLHLISDKEQQLSQEIQLLSFVIIISMLFTIFLLSWTVLTVSFQRLPRFESSLTMCKSSSSGAFSPSTATDFWQTWYHWTFMLSYKSGQKMIETTRNMDLFPLIPLLFYNQLNGQKLEERDWSIQYRTEIDLPLAILNHLLFQINFYRLLLHSGLCTE